MDIENQVTAYLDRSDTGEVPFTPPPQRIELKGTLVTFGRGIGNVVVWESLQISRRHAVMTYQNQTWKIKDTSTNGMMVNGRRIPHDVFVDLHHMDNIAFVPTGSLQYRFHKVTPPPPKFSNSPSVLQSSVAIPAAAPLRASTSYGESLQILAPSPVGSSIKSQSPKRKTNPIPCESSSAAAHSDRKRKRLLLNVPTKNEPDDDADEELLDIDEVEPFFSNLSSPDISPISTAIVKKEKELDLESIHGEDSSRVKDVIKAYKDRIAELENVTRVQKRVESEKDKEMTDLRNKLCTAQSETRVFQEELFKTLVEVMECEFSCCICNDIFIQATVIDCGHTFCAHCISEWVKRKTECPSCRKAVRIQVKHTEMENFIIKVHGMLSEDIRKRREEIIQDRTKEVNNVKAAAEAAAAAARIPHARGRGRGALNEFPFATGEQFADFLQDLQLHHEIFVPHPHHPHHRRATHGNHPVPQNVLGLGVTFAPPFPSFADLARANNPAPGPPGGRRRSTRINPRGAEAAGPSRAPGPVRGRGGHGPDVGHPSADGLQIHLSRVADFSPMDILTVD